AARQHLADAICTGLQLTNFLQDVAVDAAKGRLYVPLEDTARFGCSADDLVHGTMTNGVRALIEFEVKRARALLTGGLQLTALVEHRLAREVWLFASGGVAILDKIAAADYDVFRRRPTLSTTEKGALVLKALNPFLTAAGAPSTEHGIRTTRRPGGGALSSALRVATHSSTTDAGSVRQAYAYCQQVTRRSSSNFYYAFRLLPRERRNALYAVYAFCRFV